MGPVPSDRGRLGGAFQLLLARNKVGVPNSETSWVTFPGELRDQPSLPQPTSPLLHTHPWVLGLLRALRQTLSAPGSFKSLGFPPGGTA